MTLRWVACTRGPQTLMLACEDPAPREAKAVL